MGSQRINVREFLDRDDHDIGSRFPELEVFVPCTAPSGNVRGTSDQCCQLIQWLPIWNRVLAQFGLQLRELTAPGELSLVRIAHRGDQQEVRGRDARLLVHVLLSRHRCVVSIDLDDALVEGCGLGECRDRVLVTLFRNTSLRSLNLRSLFNDYRFIQEGLFAAIGMATQLQRLDITATGEVVPCLVDSLCSLLYMACLSTLSISSLRFDEQTTERVLDALRENTTLVDLSLHGSVLRCRNLADVPKLCSCLASKASLWHLALDGTDSEPEQTCKAIVNVLAVLAECGNLQTLRLSGFVLDGNCASALTRLVARHDGSLRQLDIGGCTWTSDDSPKGEDVAMDCDQPGTSSPEAAHAWLAPFEDFAQVTLTSLSINLEGWKPDEYTALFFVAAVLESLKTITVTGVLLSELPQVCRTIGDAGAGEKVHIKNEYLLDSVAIGMLDDCREQMTRIVLSWRSDPSVDSFCKSVQLVSSSWHNLDTLRLFLSQEALDDVSTSWSLSSYINAATRLRKLELAGCDNPHLCDSLTAENGPHSLLLDAVFSNEGLRAVRLSGIRLGGVNLRFLVGAVLSNGTLRELDVCSGDTCENEELLRLLAADFETNRTLLKCRLPNCAVDHREPWRRANMEAIISRNVGYVTCAAHYVAWEADPTRCVEALSCISKSRALIDKVQELALVDEAEAKKLVLSRLS